MGTRQKILEVARDLFLEHGLNGVSMRNVATKVGVSATAIYRHYENKNELVKHVVDMGRERFISYMGGMFDERSPEQSVRAALDGYLTFALDYPHDYKIMFLTADQIINGVHTFDYETAEGSQYGPNTVYFMDQLRRCLPEGRRGGQAVEDAFFLVWCQCHGLISAYLTGGLNELMTENEFRALYGRLIERLIVAISV